MIARRFSLKHPQAGMHNLPLLVPSFSTKGFGFISTGRGTKKRQYSELVIELSDFAVHASRAVLVSAYDLHFKHFGGPDQHAPERYMENAGLVFLDSGGYELISTFDSTEFKAFGYVPKANYGLDQYREVLQRLSSRKKPLPLVVANFDHGTRGQPLAQQISSARAIFDKHRRCATSFILRPWTRASDYVDPKQLSDKDIADLAGFDIVGVPEKELGRNLIDRLSRVAMLRRRLDNAGIAAPIQVWGGLDPLITPLLFFAGAEIFDGISWLRYAYARGVAVNRESYLLLSNIGVTAERSLNHALASRDNLTTLERLTIALQQWVDFDGAKFDMFDPNISKQLEEAYEAMETRIPELKDGV